MEQKQNDLVKFQYFILDGVLPGREITVIRIFLYLYYPGMRIRMLIRSTWGLFLYPPLCTCGMVTLTCFLLQFRVRYNVTIFNLQICLWLLYVHNFGIDGKIIY